MKYVVLAWDVFWSLFRTGLFTTLHFLWDFKFHKRYYQTEFKYIKEQLKR